MEIFIDVLTMGIFVISITVLYIMRKEKNDRSHDYHDDLIQQEQMDRIEKSMEDIRHRVFKNEKSNKDYPSLETMKEMKRIKGLEYQLGYKRESIQKLMIDTDNKVVVYQFMPGVSKKSLEDFKNASKTLTNKDYLVLAVDETFEVCKINFSDDDIKKIKDEWNKLMK